MKLVFTKDKTREVKVGDEVMTRDGAVIVTKIEKPWKPSSTGRVYVRSPAAHFSSGYFPSVIGAEWIDREDQG